MVPRSVSLFYFTVDSCERCNRKKGSLAFEDFRQRYFGGRLFKGEEKPIGRPSFALSPTLVIGADTLARTYAAWFAMAAELSRRFDPGHQERYFRYDLSL